MIIIVCGAGVTKTIHAHCREPGTNVKCVVFNACNTRRQGIMLSEADIPFVVCVDVSTPSRALPRCRYARLPPGYINF